MISGAYNPITGEPIDSPQKTMEEEEEERRRREAQRVYPQKILCILFIMQISGQTDLFFGKMYVHESTFL